MEALGRGVAEFSSSFASLLVGSRLWRRRVVAALSLSLSLSSCTRLGQGGGRVRVSGVSRGRW